MHFVKEELVQCYRSNYKKSVDAIENYISQWEKLHGKKPSEKLILAFCKARRISYPLPKEEDYIKQMVDKWSRIEEN